MKAKRMPLRVGNPLIKYQVFPPRRDYISLSVKDLLDARDAYHVYLSTLDNVVATAIGRYLIHEKDWYATHSPVEPRPPSHPLVSEPRTLSNSVVRPWSWPAVLIFVRQWADAGALGSNAVPRTLYLPDGRVIPTCVVQATPDESVPPPAPGPSFNSSLLGGGYSCLREHQGEQSLGTFACLVQKAGAYYALTNRHVAGGDGEQVQAYIRGQYHPIGTTSNLAVDRVPMSTVFSQWGNGRTYLTMDSGLIRIDNIGDWTSQVFGIGEIGEIFDATEQSVTLDLIGCPVRAFGGSTGVAAGEIRALFFRYQSLGGYEYVTDVLIGPKAGLQGLEEKPFTSPGDSGTLWFYDPPARQPAASGTPDFDLTVQPPERGRSARRLPPIAMQWGGQRVVRPDARSSSFALGMFLSSICRVLDVEVVRNWSTGHNEYWGKIGHFAIGWKACDYLSGPLGQLMKMHQVRIGFGDDKLDAGSAFRMGRGAFVPLADVPDYVWVGMKGTRPFEPIQHFADVDIYDIDGGPTLLERCVRDSNNVFAQVWKAYFDGFASKGVGPEDGCLPFRVWQIWEAMVRYLKGRDLRRFVAAAGILAHYVGDASQPLHCSYMHHGKPPMQSSGGRDYPVPRDSDQFKTFKKSRAAKIHGIYEETMLEIDPATALAGVDAALARRTGGLKVENGHDAAVATISLMCAAQKHLSPQMIIDADDANLPAKERASRLWDNKYVRAGTIQSLADSVRLLAKLWTAAWEIGGNKEVRLPKEAFSEKELENIYRRDRGFLPSLSLEKMAKSGNFEPPARQ